MAKGERALAGLLDLEREGESPLTTSCLRAEKKPCFFSIFDQSFHGKESLFRCLGDEETKRMRGGKSDYRREREW